MRQGVRAEESVSVDAEWVSLLLAAKKMGLTVQEVRAFLIRSAQGRDGGRPVEEHECRERERTLGAR
ncbi:hypothetical protein J31TS4_36100 [Paenibacillus sp. J31TS4]|uniref:anti-repressor SinI family protein n=1 Tax=Paenibacillus sp. J31TS4 TaxID=2807195 RepID=UPI001B07AE8F|nr:anti-repressor SinI family protein [Paenibacillus sp. J31TS4]GIP40330.1 hypothetical protein J31TS4_36100 [Paenibacillus sp. J31TS4]